MRTWDRLNWPAIAVLAWGSLVLGIAIHAFFWPGVHSVYYDTYAPAARNWWAGHDLYDGATPVKGYRYGPAFAVAVSPFASLSDEYGDPAWKIFNCLAYALALGTAGTRLLPRPLNGKQLAALFLLALPVSLEGMHNGQATLIVLSAILLGLTAAAAERWNLAALCLATATLIKGYPLALALVLAVLYPRRFPVRYVVAMCLGLAVPFALETSPLATAQTVHWIEHLTVSTGVTRPAVARSFDSLFRIYGDGIGNHTYFVLEVLAGIAVLGLSLLHARHTTERGVLLMRVYVFFAIWVVLFGPATESCTYVVAAPAIAWVLVEEFDRPAWWSTRVLLVASLLLMGPLVTDLPGPTIRQFAVTHGSQPIGALLFLGIVLVQAGQNLQLRSPQIDSEPGSLIRLNPDLR